MYVVEFDKVLENWFFLAGGGGKKCLFFSPTFSSVGFSENNPADGLEVKLKMLSTKLPPFKNDHKRAKLKGLV